MPHAILLKDAWMSGSTGAYRRLVSTGQYWYVPVPVKLAQAPPVVKEFEADGAVIVTFGQPRRPA
jgi:hypothetical protein